MQPTQVFTKGACRSAASCVTIFAHSFGIIAFILMLFWLLHYRNGIGYNSYGDRVFNVHPFLMFCGFIFLSAEAMMVYKTVPARHNVQKVVHMVLQLVAFVLGVVGISAVFKFHDMKGIENVYSLHSWIGISTISLIAFQWLMALVTFMFTKTESTRKTMRPWHVCGGRALLFMSIAAALTGLTEKAIFLKLQHNREARAVNFLGLFVLLFGIFVDLSVVFSRYV